MSREFYLGDFSSEKLRTYDADINPKMVLKAYDIFFALKARRQVGSNKCYHYFDPEELWKHPDYTPFKEKYARKPIEWKYNVIEAWTTFGLAGVKELHSNTVNLDLGRPRQNSTLTIRNNYTGDLLGRVESTDISNARTAFPALRMMKLCFTGNRKIVIFMFGSGPVAEWNIRLLAERHADKISSIIVCSTKPDDGTEPSSSKLVKKLGSMPFDLTPVTDRTLLPNADFVIAATSAGTPLFSDEELAPNVKTLSLSGDEMPAAHIENALKNGHVVCDDVKSASKRGGQSLQLWFERQGKLLANEAAEYGIKELATMEPLKENDGKPVHCTAVGLGSEDLVLGVLVLLFLSEKLGTERVTSILMKGLGLTG